MLNVELIKSSMARLGLSGAALADACDVSKEAVSNWLSGESMPRPKKLAGLASVLLLAVDDLFLPDPGLPPDPVVAFRMRDDRMPTAEAQEVGEDVGRHLRQLLPFMGTLFVPRCLVDPRVDESQIQGAAAAVRSHLGLNATEALTHGHLLRVLNEFGAILVPVYWGGDKVGHENAMSVYLPDSKTFWVLFNIGCRLDEFSYWLAHELGHCLSLHALAGQLGEDFAERFAKALLSPTALGSKAQKETRAASGKAAPTASDELFGTSKPSMGDLIAKGEHLFSTPVFRALARWQRSEGGRSPAFIAAALNLKLGDAVALSKALEALELEDVGA